MKGFTARVRKRFMSRQGQVKKPESLRGMWKDFLAQSRDGESEGSKDEGKPKRVQARFTGRLPMPPRDRDGTWATTTNCGSCRSVLKNTNEIIGRNIDKEGVATPRRARHLRVKSNARGIKRQTRQPRADICVQPRAPLVGRRHWDALASIPFSNDLDRGLRRECHGCS